MVAKSNANNGTNEEKIKVQEAYSQFQTILEECVASISKLHNTDDRFFSLQQDYLSLLKDKIRESRYLLDNAMKYQEWDNLVIAFFGMTNAGKSTIIETFRILFDEETRKDNLMNAKGFGVDGEIVGSGKMDFTKVYSEYKMTVNGKHFILIDVPGIEGAEKSVKNEIIKALGKAHCVFYVHGQKEKPDSKVVEKIKSYLKDWVKVYSILNVKGTSFNYNEDDERTMFKTKNILALEKQTQSVFKETLGTNYAGNITVQALLALCAKAFFSPKRADLIKEQKELLSSFNSADAILKFCNFQEIIDVVGYLSEHYAEEICEAQKKKIISLYRTTYSNLNEISATQKGRIDRMVSAFNNFKRSIKSAFNSSEQSLKNEVRNEIVDSFEYIKDQGCKAIDKGTSGNELKKFLDELKDYTSDIMNHNIGVSFYNESIDLREQIEAAANLLKQQLANVQSIQFNSNIGNMNFNFDDVISDLDFGWDDFGKWVLYFGSCFAFGWSIFAATNWWNPVGWAAGAIGILISILDSDKEGKAKQKLCEEINKSQTECFDTSYLELCKKIHNQFESQSNEMCNKSDDNIQSLNQLSSQIKSTMSLIKKYEYKLNNLGYGKL